MKREVPGTALPICYYEKIFLLFSITAQMYSYTNNSITVDGNIGCASFFRIVKPVTTVLNVSFFKLLVYFCRLFLSIHNQFIVIQAK